MYVWTTLAELPMTALHQQFTGLNFEHSMSHTSRTLVSMCALIHVHTCAHTAVQVTRCGFYDSQVGRTGSRTYVKVHRP